MSEFEQPSQMAEIESTQAKYSAWLMSLPHVVGVGIGLRQRGGVVTDEMALVVMVDQKVPRYTLEAHERIPSELDGTPVDVQEMGIFEAQ